jgi:hypothetical protein
MTNFKRGSQEHSKNIKTTNNMTDMEFHQLANEGEELRRDYSRRAEKLKRAIELRREEQNMIALERDVLLYNVLCLLGFDTPERRQLYKEFFNRVEHWDFD